MSKKAWPAVKKTQNHGNTVFVVDARKSGKGERKFFPTKGEADSWAQLQRVRRENQGGAAFDDAELAKFGLSIADAIRFTLEHYRRQHASIALPDAIAALVEAKKAAGMSKDYCRDIASRTGKLLPAFEGRMMATIMTAELDAFLGTIPTPGTRNTVRRDLCTLWSFGEKRGWCVAKIATACGIAKAADAPVEILTPGQLAEILSYCDTATIPAVVIAAFCGLRQSEVAKLDWGKVDLQERVVTVDASIAKTSARRTVEIPENAAAWLLPRVQTAGPVTPQNYRNAFDRVRVRAGFKPSFLGRADAELQSLLAVAKAGKIKLADWPGNGLRHSAISYKLAKSRDIARVALESGNSPDVIRAHYLELVKPSAAVAYFAIVPEAPQNVVVIARKSAA